MTDSTDDVDWYDGPEYDYECPQCAALRQLLAEAMVFVDRWHPKDCKDHDDCRKADALRARIADLQGRGT